MELNQIIDKLTNIGLEVEEVKDRSTELKPFKVAFVIKAEKHPNADRLKVCQVKTSRGIYQVVCGAPNAKTGMKGIFAPEGSFIPGTEIILKKTNQVYKQHLNLKQNIKLEPENNKSFGLVSGIFFSIFT